jgi:N,N'-diacetyllegionaminate synthase
VLLFFSEDARLDLLDYGLDFVKVASAELNNIHFVQSQRHLSDVFVISTGMAYLAEIAALVDSLRKNGTEKIILLECTSAYPAPPADIRLRNISYLRNTFQIPSGFSDHSRGTHMLLAAAALGARFLEKHFTLDREQAGPDHSLSADPGEMKQVIAAIREIEEAVRHEGKEHLSLTEEEERLHGRKSVHASRDIVAGEVFSPENTILKRPGTGIPPGELPFLPGRRAKSDISADFSINWSVVE